MTSAPAGITCPAACSASFDSDSQVMLTARRGRDSVFTGWTGCDSVSGATCTVTMTSARSVTAIFMLQRFTLTVTKDGLGRGTVTSSPAGVNCGTACASDYVINTTVTLTATPAHFALHRLDGLRRDERQHVHGARDKHQKSVNANFLGLPLM